MILNTSLESALAVLIIGIILFVIGKKVPIENTVNKILYIIGLILIIIGIVLFVAWLIFFLV
jgi:hypothetical protein